MTPDALEKLRLAETQLDRVLSSWDEPDWADLSIYGFHTLENGVDAAWLHVGKRLVRDHPSRVDAARHLHEKHGLPDVSDLLYDLNETRKSESYGDIEAPELDAEETATHIEQFIDAVRELVRGSSDDGLARD